MTKQPEPHKFVPMSFSKTGSVTCGKNYQFDNGRGAFCAEPPDHPIHNVEQPERTIEERMRELVEMIAKALHLAEQQRDQAEALLLRLHKYDATGWKDVESLLLSRGLL